jgi:hypothetical protein
MSHHRALLSMAGSQPSPPRSCPARGPSHSSLSAGRQFHDAHFKDEEAEAQTGKVTETWTSDNLAFQASRPFGAPSRLKSMYSMGAGHPEAGAVRTRAGGSWITSPSPPCYQLTQFLRTAALALHRDKRKHSASFPVTATKNGTASQPPQNFTMFSRPWVGHLHQGVEETVEWKRGQRSGSGSCQASPLPAPLGPACL